eukprot:s1606_g7.t1
MPDPWANGADPWSDGGKALPPPPAVPFIETFEVVETFADGQGNDLMKIAASDLKPGATGFAMVSPQDLPSVLAVFKATPQSEPCLALCPVEVPGFPAECERLLVRSSVTQRLRQLPVFLHQLGLHKVELKCEKVLQVSVSVGFFRTSNDEVTQGVETLYDVIPLDARKSLESVKSMAARLPGSPVVTFTDTQVSLLVLKEHYVACVKSIEGSFLSIQVRPFPAGGVRVLKGFCTVADASVVEQLCSQSGWTAFVESTWTYKERRDSHKRAFRVSFSEPPDVQQCSRSGRPRV